MKETTVILDLDWFICCPITSQHTCYEYKSPNRFNASGASWYSSSLQRPGQPATQIHCSEQDAVPVPPPSGAVLALHRANSREDRCSVLLADKQHSCVFAAMLMLLNRMLVGSCCVQWTEETSWTQPGEESTLLMHIYCKFTGGAENNMAASAGNCDEKMIRLCIMGNVGFQSKLDLY